MINDVSAFPLSSAVAVEEVADGIRPMDAYTYLQGKVIDTPVRRLHWLERLTGVPVWAKLENQQYTGSFKFRGASYRLRNQPPNRMVIAASAGNHGLAVAEVARRLKLKANICVPANASPLKRERILATGMGLIEYGTSLEEATEYAIEYAQDKEWTYVSPYNDPDVIAGQSTIAIEFLQKVPDLKTLIVPIGGGGLISGIALGAQSIDKNITLYGSEPAGYSSMSHSLLRGKASRVVNQPTFADGLAVNLEAQSITLDIVRNLVSDIITLSEEDLAASTLAILFHESLLVEPAGAASILACLKLAREGRLEGPVGLPFCGGNLHHTTLARIQRFPFTNPECLKLLDLRGRSPVAQPITRILTSAKTTDDDSELGSVKSGLASQIDYCIKRLDRIPQQLNEFVEYSHLHKLIVSKESVALVKNQVSHMRGLLSETMQGLAEVDIDEKSLNEAEIVLRLGLQTFAATRNAFDWRSPSYAQVSVAQFFDLGAQDNPLVNYERYEYSEIKRIESQLLDMVGLPPDRFNVTVTSSGMAAYSLAEAYLLRNCLPSGATVLLAPYIYFEAEEQIVSLQGVQVVKAANYSVESFLAAAEKHRPSVIFADPLTNTVEQRIIDIDALVQGLAERELGPVTVLVDGTMLPGMTASALLNTRNDVSVLYYESCSKYLQLGLDLSMAGFVAHSVDLKPVFDRLRRNMGAILYSHNAYMFPIYKPAEIHQYLRRIERNATEIALALDANPAVRAVTKVVYPGISTHPDHAIAKRLGQSGGCVTFQLHEIGENHRDQLESLIDLVLNEAAKEGAYLSKGVSFGFSAPRISAASSMAESGPPFLRLYAGSRERSQVRKLIRAIITAMHRMGAQRQ